MKGKKSILINYYESALKVSPIKIPPVSSIDCLGVTRANAPPIQLWTRVKMRNGDKQAGQPLSVSKNGARWEEVMKPSIIMSLSLNRSETGQ